MSTVTTIAETDAQQSLQALARLYRAGFQSTYLDNILHRALRHQIERDRVDLARIEATLAQFEQTYGLASGEFWQRFQAGQMADTADFMEWNAFCKMRQRILSRLDILGGNGKDKPVAVILSDAAAPVPECLLARRRL